MQSGLLLTYGAASDCPTAVQARSAGQTDWELAILSPAVSEPALGVELLGHDAALPQARILQPPLARRMDACSTCSSGFERLQKRFRWEMPAWAAGVNRVDLLMGFDGFMGQIASGQ